MISLDFAKSTAFIGPVRLSVSAAESGAVAIDAPLGPVLKPLSVLERQQCIDHALSVPYDQQGAALAQEALARATVKSANEYSSTTDNPSALSALALYLAGADNPAPNLPESLRLVNTHFNWQPDSVWSTPAAQFDQIVASLTPVSNSGWNQLIMHDADGDPATDITLRLADKLLDRYRKSTDDSAQVTEQWLAEHNPSTNSTDNSPAITRLKEPTNNQNSAPSKLSKSPIDQDKQSVINQATQQKEWNDDSQHISPNSASNNLQVGSHSSNVSKDKNITSLSSQLKNTPVKRQAANNDEIADKITLKRLSDSPDHNPDKANIQPATNSNAAHKNHDTLVLKKYSQALPNSQTPQFTEHKGLVEQHAKLQKAPLAAKNQTPTLDAAKELSVSAKASSRTKAPVPTALEINKSPPPENTRLAPATSTNTAAVVSQLTATLDDFFQSPQTSVADQLAELLNREADLRGLD